MPILAQDERLQACFRDLSLRVATLPLCSGRDRWLNLLLEQGWGARKGISSGLQVSRWPDALNHTLASQCRLGGSSSGTFTLSFLLSLCYQNEPEGEGPGRKEESGNAGNSSVLVFKPWRELRICRLGVRVPSGAPNFSAPYLPLCSAMR